MELDEECAERRRGSCVGTAGCAVDAAADTVLEQETREQHTMEPMERMESMEPISTYYTTAYPEIQPDSGFGSSETTDGQPKTPPAPAYDEELVHKVRTYFSIFPDIRVCGMNQKM